MHLSIHRCLYINVNTPEVCSYLSRPWECFQNQIVCEMPEFASFLKGPCRIAMAQAVYSFHIPNTFCLTVSLYFMNINKLSFRKDCVKTVMINVI